MTSENKNPTQPEPRNIAAGTIQKANEFFLFALLTDKVFIQKEKQKIIDASEVKDNFVVYYLYCHAIELSLKSFLMVKGFSDVELKRIGHDFENALSTAKEYGLNNVVDLSEEEVEAIIWTGDYYKAKVFEYLITGYYSIPDLQYVHSASLSLITKLKPYIRSELLKKKNLTS